MYPRLSVDLLKVTHNTRTLVAMAREKGIGVYGVTKVHYGHPGITEAMVKGGIEGIADSRMENLEAMGDYGIPRMLLRLPMLSEASRVVAGADISLNSEMATIKALGRAAVKQGKIHQIILMIDLGDLREGIEPRDVHVFVPEIMKTEGIELLGIGVNLTCYGGVIPDEGNLGELAAIAGEVQKRHGVSLKVVSGGNSSSLYLLKGDFPKGINQLRLGEGIVLGRETTKGDPIPGTYQDAFILEAELIEVKEKDSYPRGTIGMDAFGNRPTYVDKGRMKRGILAVGRQDVVPEGLTPFDSGIEVIGASSDHTILDLTPSGNAYEVGDILRFRLSYGALLALSTSAYVTVHTG
ncbi:MAG: alanine racemase [delta proteobacterium ML8_F1]|nr:MAG: alanine racemase [delta proteobacterium ML8_F1]